MTSNYLDDILANESLWSEALEITDLFLDRHSCAVLAISVTFPDGMVPERGVSLQWCPVVPDELAFNCCVLGPDEDQLKAARA